MTQHNPIAPEKNSNEKMAVSLTPQGFEVAPDEPILIYKKGNHLEGENVLTPALHSVSIIPAKALGPATTIAPATDEAIELDMWEMVWDAIALDDALETFTYIWQVVKNMGPQWARKVAKELPDLVAAIDPKMD